MSQIPSSRRMDRFQDLLLGAILWLLQIVPEGFIRGLACLIGLALSGLLRSRRRIMEENIRTAFGPEIGHDQVTHICQRAWINLALTSVEVLRFPRHGERYVRELRVEGLEYVDRSFAAGRGVIFVVPHLGNWEIGGAYFARRFPFAVIARPLKQGAAARALDEIREQMGMKVIARKSALKSVLIFLRKGGVVAFMLDQHASRHNVIVPFFGRPAKTFNSAAALALRTGAAVHLGYTWRRDDGSLVLKFHPAIPAPVTGDSGRDIHEATARYTAAIEGVVREHPDCWLWMHRRWRPVK